MVRTNLLRSWQVNYEWGLLVRIYFTVAFHLLLELITIRLTRSTTLYAVPMVLTAINSSLAGGEEHQTNAPSTIAPNAIEHPSSECCETCSSPADCQSSEPFFYNCAEYPVMRNMMVEEARICQDRSSQAAD